MQMKVQTLMIDAASKLLMNQQLWEDAKQLCADIDNSKKLTSTEKHAKVITDLKKMFTDIATATLNLAVAMAVVWIRSQEVK